MRSLIVVVAFAALGVSGASGDAQVSIGTTTMVLPAPEGFVLMTEDMTTLRQKSLSLVPDGNEQLALFIPREDAPAASAGGAPEMRRWFAAQIRKSTATQPVGSEFLAEVERSIIKHSAETLKTAREAAKHHIRDRVERGLIRPSDAPDIASAAMTEPFMRTSHSLGVLIQSDNRFIENNVMSGNVLNSASVLLIVKNRLLFLYVNDVTGDKEWVKATARNWSESVYDRNRETVP